RILPTTFSKGWPLRSYMASRKKGSIRSIITMAAAVVPRGVRSKKYSGTPTRAAAPKQSSCRLVRLNAILDLTLVKSLGTGTYAIQNPPLSVCGKQCFTEASRLEERKAQQNGIAHARPHGGAHVGLGGNALHQHGVDSHADDDEKCLEPQGQQRPQVVLPHAAELPSHHGSHGNGCNGGHEIDLNHSAEGNEHDEQRQHPERDTHD